MLTSLIALFGGSAFRMVWGEVSAWMTARGEHKREVELMKLQGEHDAARFLREQEAIKQQHQLGIEVVRVKGAVDHSLQEDAIWGKGVELAMKPTGVWIVDLWNGLVRPSAATIALVLWVVALSAQGWVMQVRDWELVCAILGFFFADRAMSKRGK